MCKLAMVGQGNAQHSGNDLKATNEDGWSWSWVGWVGLSWVELSWVGLSWLGCVLSGRIDWFIIWVGRVAGSIQHWPSLPSGSLVITWCQPLLLPFIFFESPGIYIVMWDLEHNPKCSNQVYRSGESMHMNKLMLSFKFQRMVGNMASWNWKPH